MLNVQCFEIDGIRQTKIKWAIEFGLIHMMIKIKISTIKSWNIYTDMC